MSLPNQPKPALSYLLYFKDGTTETVNTRVGHQLHRTQNALHRISINDPSYLLDIEVNGKLLDFVEANHQSGNTVRYKYNSIQGNHHHNASSSLLETLEDAVALVQSGSLPVSGSVVS